METEKKPRKGSRDKIAVTGIFLIIVLTIAIAAWQYTTIGPNTPVALGPAPDFPLMDINSTSIFTLGEFKGKVIAIHFMIVGCHGEVYSIDDSQLRQLRSVCNSFCGDGQFVIITVLSSMCLTSNLTQIRLDYDITWRMGNDYNNGMMDIFKAYEAYSVKDGTIVLVNKMFNVTAVHTEAMTASALFAEIDQLLKA